ncbi:MAG: putative DNA binding domain-containing protein [Acidobacteria bacterium]|nr:putative DNA binding domain-containing protein [Acidobacteriota bacterium]
MARRKYRSTQPVTERSFLEYLSTPALQTSRIELLRLVRGGEDTYLELKVKLSNPEKIAQGICALANTGGGVMVFGVSDQLRVEGVDDPEDVRDELVRICREQISPQLVPYIDLIAFDNGRRVVAVEIEGKRRPYQTRDGRYFIRIGADKREASREELSALLDEARPFRYENVAVTGASDADIDEAHLWSFVREFSGDAFDTNASVPDYPTADVLKRDLLLAAGNMDVVVPTVAGLLLFGRDERVAELLPRSTVTAVRYAGDTVQDAEIERVVLKGNLHTLYESCLRFVTRYCDLLDARPRPRPQTSTGDDAPDDAPVAARANYDRAAVREGIANALAHRDLALRDHTTRLLVFDHSIEILNPRRTVGFAPPAQKAIRYGVPQQLNPQLAAIFRSPAYGLDLSPGGLPMLLRHARLFSGRRADINAFNDEFRLRLYGV